MAPVHRRLLRCALAATLLLALSACTGANPSSTVEDPLPVAEVAAEAGGHAHHQHHDQVHGSPSDELDTPSEAAPEEIPADDGAITVSMVDIAFEPSRIDLNAGEPVSITVRNDGNLEHDFDLPAANLHLHGMPGDEATATLLIAEPGTYEAQCLIAGHAEAGMTMEVVVD